MPDNVKKIIDEWDPVGLLAFCPADEYSPEIEQIESCLAANENISPQQLAQEINKIFLQAFGNDVYRSDLTICLTVAQKILN